MDVDHIYISIYTLFYLHGMYFLHNILILALAILLPKILSLSQFYRMATLVCVTAYILFFGVKRYVSSGSFIPSDETHAVPPDIDTAPTLSRNAKPTMQTSPTFERVQAAGKAKPPHAVVWPKSQVWKRDALAGKRNEVEKREVEMRW